jgi:hypothetical protein
VSDGCTGMSRAAIQASTVSALNTRESFLRHVCGTDDEPIHPGVLGGLVEVQGTGEASLWSDWRRPAHAQELADIGECAERGTKGLDRRRCSLRLPRHRHHGPGENQKRIRTESSLLDGAQSNALTGLAEAARKARPDRPLST